MKRRLLEALKLVKPLKPHLPQPNVSGTFAKNIGEVLTIEQTGKAFLFYNKHKVHIDKLLSTTKIMYEPSQTEDKNDPMIWKAEYWKCGRILHRIQIIR